MTAHSTLTGADLHEPKGVASAASGQVYVANGSGSGVWTTKPISYVNLHGTWTDISTAQTIYVPCPVAGTIKKIYVTIDAAINTADSNLTFLIGGVPITSSAITATQSGSAPGTTYSSTPSAANAITAGQTVTCVTDGASTGVAISRVSILVQVT